MGNCLYIFRFSLIVVVLMGLQVGCDQPRGTDYASRFSGGPTANLTSVDFATLRSQVLNPYGCIRCHSSMGSEEGLASYVSAGNPEASSLYTSVASGRMPPEAPLAASGVQIVRAYILGSTVEKKQHPQKKPQPPTASEAVDFAMLKSEVLAPYCLDCHEDFGTAVGLSAYVVTGKPEQSSLLQRVLDGTMPPGETLSEDSVSWIRKYIESK